MKPKTKKFIKFIKWGFIIIVVLGAYVRWSSSSLEEKVSTLAFVMILVSYYLWAKEKADETKNREDLKRLLVRDQWLLLRMEYLQNPEEFERKYKNGIDDYFDFPLLTQYSKEHFDFRLIFTMEREGMPDFQFYD